MQKQINLGTQDGDLTIKHAVITLNHNFELVDFNSAAQNIFELEKETTSSLLEKLQNVFGNVSLETLCQEDLYLEKADGPGSLWTNTCWTYERDGAIFHSIALKEITEIVKQIDFTQTIEQEKRYRFLFDHIPIPLWEEDFSAFLAYLDQLRAEGHADLETYFRDNPDETVKFLELVKILDVNLVCLEKNGVTKKEDLTGTLATSFMTQSREMILDEIISLIQGNTKFDGESSRVTLEGKRMDMRVQLRIPDEYKDTWERVLVSTQDITRSKQTEIRLREAVAQNKQLMKAITSIFIQIDAKRKIVQWNQKASDVLGVKTEDVVHNTIENCSFDWDQKRILDGLQQCEIFQTQVRLDDVYFRRKSGGEGYLGITLNPIMDEEDKSYMGCLLLGADITDRKLMETQLLQAQKLESIGQLAAGIAHEINTPTQYIGDNIRFLKESYADLYQAYQAVLLLTKEAETAQVLPDALENLNAVLTDVDMDYLMEEIPLAVQQSLEGIERVSTIVRAMKEFSHPGSSEKTPTDINHAIENTLTVARNEWKYIAEVERDYAENLPLVPCLPGEFNQVILNLITNAAHAISKALSNEPGELGRIHIKTRKVNEMVEIQIADTGTGIPEKLRNKVFDPFFTTKEVGRGTGQGLTIAYNVIVEKHGGILTFETEVGKGTTFIIQLPLQAQAL
jgi:PAS domain S-box-containing protein